MEPTQTPEGEIEVAGATGGDGTAEGCALVVGIGASAGGLDAFKRLLGHLQPDTRCAFVLVQHLDATHPSRLTEILGRATAMPVQEACDGVRVAPDHIYVIQPNTELTICDGILRLAPRQSAGPHLPIDAFFQSLAEDQGERAVGILLSGTGTDGVAGLLAVKDANGMTFAQEPRSAEFPGMPAAAASAGSADVVLAPEDIAAALGRLARRPRPSVSPAAAEPQVAALAASAEQLRVICDIMYEATGIDFSLYRETTVQRRLARRLAVRDVADLGAYARLLAEDAGERDELRQDLLICVTSFFREPAAFEALKKLVFPVITRDRAPSSTLRIWVPGCATGEEAYSILIALQEFQSERRTAFPVQLFATDLNEAAIQKARAGRYPARIAAEVGPERLRRYFKEVDGAYQIAKPLREACVFSRHNLLDDPPFSKLDLISCRNVLIYLQGGQRTLVPLFHYALVEHGFLLLGRSETTRDAELFTPLEPRHRIFSKRQVAKKPYASFSRARVLHPGAGGLRAAEAQPPRRAADLSRDVDRALLSRYSPAGVVVDEALEVLEIRGKPGPFLSLTSGKASFHLLKLLPDTGLFLEVERLTRDAAASNQVARGRHVPYDVDGHSGEINLEVAPLGSKERRAFLILFEAVTPEAPAAAASNQSPAPASERAGLAGDQKVARLSRELADVRARLVSIVADHEASDEENQQITEDALSANEELQSLTEELETAKEELESTNEELLTLNRELESRNVALASAAQLAMATVETVGVPLLVVDAELAVKYVNAAFASQFQVSAAGAEGQALYALSGGAWNLGELRAELEGLRATGKPFERLEVVREFPAIGRRVLLLSGRRLDDLDLVLLTVEDVSGQREAEQALQRSEEQRRQSERMETVGRLAGGIAHDFNNLLTVIIGDAELLRDIPPEDTEAGELVEEICVASRKAAALTDQLLAFSRRKVLQSRIFDLNPVISDFERMARRLLGETIQVAVQLSQEACLVKSDSGEIGRVLMNLCVNARDAMPAGGLLRIETGHVDLDAALAATHDMPPGPYVQLVVADTGLGMDAETCRHVFEPFFTTKAAREGAGLGLATVFGILRQSGGAIRCESELGRGTRFTVLLPVPDSSAISRSSEQYFPGLTLVPRGTAEVVLLVEDQADVRRLTKKVLERAGYRVLEADNGRTGLSVIESHPGRVDLLVTDVVMPEMGGGELAERALRARPGLKVLFISGHNDDVLVKAGVVQGSAFLQKPFTPAELGRKVREVLDAR